MGQARLYVIIHDGTSRILVDVVVCSPYAGDQNFRAACARRDGYASRRAAIAKHVRYPSAELTPFALEMGERLGSQAHAVLITMADAAEDRNLEL